MNRRRFLRVAGGTASLFGPALGAIAGSMPVAIQHKQIEPALQSRLDHEIGSYMQANNAPGMQFALVDLHGTEYIASYGYENLQTQKSLRPDRLFQIGSISKSMATVAALQLVDEGKLDLHRPVLEYLPWLPWKTSHGAVSLLAASNSKMRLPAPIAMAAAEKNHEVVAASKAPQYPQFLGSYVNDDPWDGLIEISEQDGSLRADGSVLQPAGDGSFYLLSEPNAPNRLGFDCTIGGKAQVLLLNGTEYRRWNSAQVI